MKKTFLFIAVFALIKIYHVNTASDDGKKDDSDGGIYNVYEGEEDWYVHDYFGDKKKKGSGLDGKEQVGDPLNKKPSQDNDFHVDDYFGDKTKKSTSFNVKEQAGDPLNKIPSQNNDHHVSDYVGDKTKKSTSFKGKEQAGDPLNKKTSQNNDHHVNHNVGDKTKRNTSDIKKKQASSEPPLNQKQEDTDKKNLVLEKLQLCENTNTELHTCQEHLRNCQSRYCGPVISGVTYFKHFIRSFLQHCESMDDQYVGFQVKLLKENQRKLDAILSNSDDKSTKLVLDLVSDSIEPITMPLLDQVKDQAMFWPIIIGLTCCNALILLLTCFRQHLPTRSPWKIHVLSVLFFCFLCSIPWEWYRLYKEKLAEKTATISAAIPLECTPHDLTAWASLKLWMKDTFTVSDNVCVKYHKDVLVDPIWEISPLQAATVSAMRLIVEPMKQFFSALGTSFRLLLKELPVQWQPIIAVTVILVILFLASVFIMTASGLEIRTPLLSIGFRNQQTAIEQYQLQIENLKKENNELVEERNVRVQHLPLADAPPLRSHEQRRFQQIEPVQNIGSRQFNTRQVVYRHQSREQVIENLNHAPNNVESEVNVDSNVIQSLDELSLEDQREVSARNSQRHYSDAPCDVSRGANRSVTHPVEHEDVSPAVQRQASEHNFDSLEESENLNEISRPELHHDDSIFNEQLHDEGSADAIQEIDENIVSELDINDYTVRNTREEDSGFEIVNRDVAT